MEYKHTPKSINFYVKEIRGLLPKKAFLEAKYKVAYLFVHFCLVLAGLFLIKKVEFMLVEIPLILFITHNLACIGFLSHELSHNSIVRKKSLRYALEVFFWGMILVPATMWRKVHNETHHHTMNTPQDPDRRTFESEKSISTIVYNKLFYPHENLKWNPIVGFAFIPYIIKHTIAAFYKGESKPEIVTAKPSYSRQDKWLIFLEICLIIGIQCLIFLYLGVNQYLMTIPISIMLTSFVLMTYIVTNHLRNPHFKKTPDPLLTSTSVIVPKVIDKLHYNFSYHTEHHIMASMNSDYYPIISKILKEKYPNRYNSIPIKEALTEVWKYKLLVSDKEILVNENE